MVSLYILHVLQVCVCNMLGDFYEKEINLSQAGLPMFARWPSLVGGTTLPITSVSESLKFHVKIKFSLIKRNGEKATLWT